MFNRQIIWKRAVFNSYGGNKPTYNWGASILLEQHLSWSRYTGKHREWSSHHRIGNPYSCHYISLLTVMWQSPKMGMFQLLTQAHIMIFLLPALIAKGKAFMFTSWINTQYIYICMFAEEPFILSLILSQILIHVLLLLVLKQPNPQVSLAFTTEITQHPH